MKGRWIRTPRGKILEIEPETEEERRELARRLAEGRGGIDLRDVWDPIRWDWVRDEEPSNDEAPAGREGEPLSARTASRDPYELRFYSHRRGDYACFSNFFPSPFSLENWLWPTVEHYFQAMKFRHDPHRADRIRRAPSPGSAKRLGQEPGRRSDWWTVRNEVMLDGLRAKFSQCLALGELLRSTRGATLIEASPYDDYWGEGADGTGQNMLGRLLMEVRAELSRQG